MNELVWRRCGNLSAAFADAFAEPLVESEPVQQRSSVERFLAGSRLGEPKKLLDVLDRAFAVHADAAAAPGSVPSELVGAEA